MILEGLVTTLDVVGKTHLAPMGPRVDAPNFCNFLLRPFPTSNTYQNLVRHPEGVLHITDDVLLLARAAVGEVTTPPTNLPTKRIRGAILADACRYFEFRVTSIDDQEPRVRMLCEVVDSGTLRDFFGFNRAKHAVLEAAILATRFQFLGAEQIETEFRRLRQIVDKTAGEQEFAAMEFLEKKWQRHKEVTR